MTRKARLWTGVTILVVLVLNYAAFAIPLAQRSSSIEEKAMSMMRKQFESGSVSADTGDDYIIQILKKEKATIDKKLAALNMAAASCAILVASWILFGLVSNKGGRG
jgi:hypothetical protein